MTLTRASIIIKNLVLLAGSLFTVTLAVQVFLYGDMYTGGLVICSFSKGFYYQVPRFGFPWHALHRVVGAKETCALRDLDHAGLHIVKAIRNLQLNKGLFGFVATRESSLLVPKLQLISVCHAFWTRSVAQHCHQRKQ